MIHTQFAANLSGEAAIVTSGRHDRGFAAQFRQNNTNKPSVEGECSQPKFTLQKVRESSILSLNKNNLNILRKMQIIFNSTIYFMCLYPVKEKTVPRVLSFSTSAGTDPTTSYVFSHFRPRNVTSNNCLLFCARFFKVPFG